MVTLFANGRPIDAASNDLTVYVNGARVFNTNRVAFGAWVAIRSTAWVATGTSATLKLATIDACGGDCTTFVDTVGVQQVAYACYVQLYSAEYGGNCGNGLNVTSTLLASLGSQALSSWSYPVLGSNFGADPVPGCGKSLVVTYACSCQPGVLQLYTLAFSAQDQEASGLTLTLSCANTAPSGRR